MKMSGRIWVYGDNVDTDAIIPARYLLSSDANELARHCMEGLDAEFSDEEQSGDLIVAGENFGCGSSREHAPIAIKASGVSCIVARSFARIFYRNAINIGLPIVVCPEAVESAEQGQNWDVDLETGMVRNLTLDSQEMFEPFPPFMMELLTAGGLTAHTRNRIAAGNLPRVRTGP
jgi:3-isopropylmalate/(R)-2-methylmalate dehydratase small subunit